jgi:hypothetical protein
MQEFGQVWCFVSRSKSWLDCLWVTLFFLWIAIHSVRGNQELSRAPSLPRSSFHESSAPSPQKPNLGPRAPFAKSGALNSNLNLTSPHHNNGRPNSPTHPSRLSRAVSRRKHQHPAAAGCQAGRYFPPSARRYRARAHCARSHSSATASPTRPTSFPPLPAAATSSARSRQEHC